MLARHLHVILNSKSLICMQLPKHPGILCVNDDVAMVISHWEAGDHSGMLEQWLT